MPKRSYADEEKATALAMLDDNGGNLSKTQRETGVPRTTLKDWRDGRRGMNGAVTRWREEKRLDLAACYEEFQHKALPVAEGKLKDASLKDLMTASGIAADKMAMLRGQQPPQEGRVNVFIQMNRGKDGFPF